MIMQYLNKLPSLFYCSGKNNKQKKAHLSYRMRSCITPVSYDSNHVTSNTLTERNSPSKCVLDYKVLSGTHREADTATHI